MKELAAQVEAGGAQGLGLYDADPWSWSQQQAEALRRRDLGAIDWDNVIEEIEDVGNRRDDEGMGLALQERRHAPAEDPARPGQPGSVRHWRGRDPGGGGNRCTRRWTTARA